MPALTEEIPTLLKQFDPRIRQEAERLVDDDAVVGIDLLEDEMMAEVKLDKQAANVRWQHLTLREPAPARADREERHRGGPRFLTGWSADE